MAARITAYIVAIIVGLTFIAGLIVGAQRDDDGPVDLIVVNGNVYTADGEGTTAEAIAVQGNKILRVGSNREVQRLRRPQTIVVDAKGGAVLPGFNDSHVQFVNAGLALTHIDLTDATTLQEIEATIAAWAKAHPDRDWVTGRGWSNDIFADDPPTREQLDAIVSDRPAFLTSDDGESMWANSAALNLAKITRRTPNPNDGTIVKDPRTGEPTGVLKASAMALVARLVPEPTRAEQMDAVRAAMVDAHRRGVTSIQDIDGSVASLELYEELRRLKELDVRVYGALNGRLDPTATDIDTLDRVLKKYGDDPLFKAGAVKLEVTDDVSADALNAAVAALDERGWQVIVHALGESAVRMAREAIEYAVGKNEVPERGRRHRVEHHETEDRLLTVSAILDVPGIVNRAVLEKAIDTHTRDAAWASFDEHRKGSLERDMLADIVILTQDIFTVSPRRLAEADVAVTIFNGKVVYSRPSETND